MVRVFVLMPLNVVKCSEEWFTLFCNCTDCSIHIMVTGSGIVGVGCNVGLHLGYIGDQSEIVTEAVESGSCILCQLVA